MGVTPLTNEQLWQNHRIEVKIPIASSGTNANVVEVVREFEVDNQELKTLFVDPGWNGEAPLWFYILKEAELVGDGTATGKGRTLGSVGGRIVAEVTLGRSRRCASPTTQQLSLVSLLAVVAASQQAAAVTAEPSSADFARGPIFGQLFPASRETTTL